MPYSEELIQKVWEKATVVHEYNSEKFRQAHCKAWIVRSEYGNRESPYGWEIDHIKPLSEGGTDDLSNLRPLQWENNASKQAGRLDCVKTSSGNQNVSVI